MARECRRPGAGPDAGGFRSPNALGRWAVVSVLAALIVGCATPPPASAPAPAAPVEAQVPEPVCAPCVDQSGEIARLRQELASREAELRELRSQRRDQTKALQESAEQATRAKVKLRRLATQAEAASYIAEVEMAMEKARSNHVAGSGESLLTLAQAILQSSAAPFAQGDYPTAMDLAAQAEQLIGIVAETPHRPKSGARGARAGAEIPLEGAIPLQTKSECNLRRQPRGKAPVIRILKEGSPLLAYAYRDHWLRVETEDGRTGWIYQSLVTAGRSPLRAADARADTQH